MSAEAAAASLPLKARLRALGRDQDSVRIIRYAFGVTLSAALAYGINWPLSFLLPVLAFTWIFGALIVEQLEGLLLRLHQPIPQPPQGRLGPPVALVALEPDMLEKIIFTIKNNNKCSLS